MNRSPSASQFLAFGLLITFDFLCLQRDVALAGEDDHGANEVLLSVTEYSKSFFSLDFAT